MSAQHRAWILLVILMLNGVFTERGLGISVVLVLLEGGYDAIDDVAKSLTSKIPVVLCEGTGRAADILAYASTHMFTQQGFHIYIFVINLSVRYSVKPTINVTFYHQIT